MHGAGHADVLIVLQMPGNKAGAVPCERLLITNHPQRMVFDVREIITWLIISPDLSKPLRVALVGVRFGPTSRNDGCKNKKSPVETGLLVQIRGWGGIIFQLRSVRRRFWLFLRPGSRQSPHWWPIHRRLLRYLHRRRLH